MESVFPNRILDTGRCDVEKHNSGTDIPTGSALVMLKYLLTD